MENDFEAMSRPHAIVFRYRRGMHHNTNEEVFDCLGCFETVAIQRNGIILLYPFYFFSLILHCGCKR